MLAKVLVKRKKNYGIDLSANLVGLASGADINTKIKTI
jgi:hypothetical protein